MSIFGDIIKAVVVAPITVAAEAVEIAADLPAALAEATEKLGDAMEGSK